MNVFLQPKINWKNLCFIFTILFFIVGVFIGKSFANGVNNAQVISGNGPLVYNLDNNPIINQQAVPLVPNKNKINITAIPTLTDGSTITSPYNQVPIQFYNLNLNYNSPVKGFAKFVIQYTVNGVVASKEVCYPIKEGNNKITILNWLIKGPVYDNLQIINSYVIMGH